MIKAVRIDSNIYEVDTSQNYHVRTDFIADDETDITAMNASGSEYLNYPSGSMVYCVENGKRYILNAARTEYVEVI